MTKLIVKLCHNGFKYNPSFYYYLLLIKNNLRTLDDHLMILLNGPEIENFDYLKVLEHWEGKKTRRII